MGFFDDEHGTNRFWVIAVVVMAVIVNAYAIIKQRYRKKGK